MIRLVDVNKFYPTRHGPVPILRDVNMEIAPGERMGILGRNGAGKSTLIRLISGAELPTSGAVERHMSVSWPLAFGGAFQGALTGIDNLRFICRIYGVDPEDKIDFVQEFSELGIYLREPVRSYSAGMRARLAFAISMTIEFDCFLIDEIVAVGDSRFHEKCHTELFEKRGDRAMIIVSHDASYIREHCTRASVLSGGRLHLFPTLDEAFIFYYYGEPAAAA
jgi:capsular polysaccharide transport system ATP-binding protein